jgi:hypothetical protein
MLQEGADKEPVPTLSGPVGMSEEEKKNWYRSVYDTSFVCLVERLDDVNIHGRDFGYPEEGSETMVEEGKVEHELWMDLILHGAPAIFVYPVFDVDGKLMKGKMVLVAKDVREEVRFEYKRLAELKGYDQL